MQEWAEVRVWGVYRGVALVLVEALVSMESFVGVDLAMELMKNQTLIALGVVEWERDEELGL